MALGVWVFCSDDLCGAGDRSGLLGCVGSVEYNVVGWVVDESGNKLRVVGFWVMFCGLWEMMV